MIDVTNIIGGPLNDDILNQFITRAKPLTQDGMRNDADIRMLSEKNCWVKLSSFINVTDTSIIPSGVEGKGGKDWNLSANWVLQGGVKYLGDMRGGVSPGSGLYGAGGISELGYRPMPGIESVTIEAQPPLGAIRTASVKIKAWNLNQLSALDMLYFRLGCSMLLEFGHSVYTKNDGGYVHRPSTVDLFSKTGLAKNKETILSEIEGLRQGSSYNYDGILGLVSNYEWTQAGDGSYDCTVKLVGYGSIIESLKVNGQACMPPSVIAVDPSTYSRTVTATEKDSQHRREELSNATTPNEKALTLLGQSYTRR